MNQNHVAFKNLKEVVIKNASISDFSIFKNQPLTNIEIIDPIEEAMPTDWKEQLAALKAKI